MRVRKKDKKEKRRKNQWKGTKWKSKSVVSLKLWTTWEKNADNWGQFHIFPLNPKINEVMVNRVYKIHLEEIIW